MVAVTITRVGGRVDYTFAVSLIATGVGGLIAGLYGWGLGSVSARERGFWRLIACMPFLIPSYLLATTFLGWLGRHDWLGPFQGGAAGRIEPVRIWACGLLLGTSGWPLVLLVCSWVWERMERSWREAAGLELRAWDRWVFVYLPLFGRPAVVGLGLLMLWSSLQFMVPLALGVPVTAVRIHARFNTYFELSKALSGSIGSILGWACGWVLWVGLIRGMTRIELSGAPADRGRSPGVRGVRVWTGRVCMAVVLACTVGLPLAALVDAQGAVWNAFAQIGRFDRGLLAQTVGVAAGGATIAAMVGGLGVMLGLVFGGGVRGGSVLEVRDSLLLLPWLMPGVLLGAVCVRGLSSLSWAGWFYPTTGFLIVLLAVRTLFAPVKVMRLMGSTLPRSWFEAAALHQLSRRRVFFVIALPLLAPGLLVGWAVAYWLILAETGLLVMVAPAGMETLMMRVFHLLHYGYEDEVAAACLWVLILGLGPLLAGGWAVTKLGRGRLC